MIEFNATLIIAMLSFVVFIIIMNAILYEPILCMMRKREKYIADNYEQANSLKDKTDSYKKQKEDSLKKVRMDCRLKVESTVEEAQNISNKVAIEQKEKSKNEIQIKKELLLSESQKLKESIKSSVIDDLSSSLVDKVLKG